MSDSKDYTSGWTKIKNFNISRKFIFLFLLTCALTWILILNTRANGFYSTDGIVHFLGGLRNPNITNITTDKTVKATKSPKKCSNITTSPILTSWNDGRLGNQMFSYSVLYAVAKRENRTAFMSPSMSKHLSKYFKVSLPPMTQSDFTCVQWTKRALSRSRDASLKLTRNVKTKHVMYTGYPESWKHFEDFLPEIKNEFRFLDNISSMSNDTIKNAVNESFGDNVTNVNVTTVGVHVRRTDYIGYSKAVNIELPTIEYYVGAMRYFQEKYKNVIFLVASDDNKWCVKNFSPLINKSEENPLRISFLNGKPDKGGLDLAVLAHCDNVIFGIGTFGFWGGYLSNGETIFCADCIQPTSRWMKLLLDYGNFVLPTWKGFTRAGKPTTIIVKWKDPSLITTTARSNESMSILSQFSELWKNKILSKLS